MKTLAARLAICWLSATCLSAESLPAVLARMDATASTFRGVTAKLKRSTLTAILNETSEELGFMTLAKLKGGPQVLIELTKPAPKFYYLRDRTAEVYFPKINTVQVYDLGKQKGVVEQFLLLGFGTSGNDLAKNYTIKLVGEETAGGEKAARIELTPKSGKVKEYFSKVELWIPSGAGYPVQQRFLQPSGDTTTITYTELKLNPELAPGALSLKAPPGAKREYPQK